MVFSCWSFRQIHSAARPLPVRACIPGCVLFPASISRGQNILCARRRSTFTGQDLFRTLAALPGNDEWLPAEFTGGVKAVDVKARSVITVEETFKAAVANVIPAQKAGHLAQQMGFADRSGWCPVDPVTFESTLQPGIHLVGDAIIAGDMPKSAFSANSQAKACAFAVASVLTGSSRSPTHLFNTCYTFLAPDDAWSNAISYKPLAGTIRTEHAFISKVDESSEVRRRAAREAEGWYDAFTRDVFG